VSEHIADNRRVFDLPLDEEDRRRIAAVTQKGGNLFERITYTITITNNGPAAAQGVVLSDTLPAGSQFVSMTKTAGTDSFTLNQSGGSATETATANIASGNSDTLSFQLGQRSPLQ
jgi:uncharacterized repeat protein (TIGR01451 family)